MKQKTLIIVICSLLIVMGCSQNFERKNPVDPQSPNYIPQTAPAVPALMDPANGDTGIATYPKLSWNIVSNATSYTLQVSTSNTFGSFVYNQSGITDNGQAVNLDTVTTYYWRVCATNSYGTSGWSEVWHFTTSNSINTILVAYYPFNGNANDLTGNGFNGVINGGVTLTTDRFSSSAAAYAFDGIDDDILVTHDVNLQPSNITVSAWIYPTSYPGNGQHGVVVHKGSTDNSQSWELLTRQGTTSADFEITFQYRGSAGNCNVYITTNAMSLNNWHHVVGVYNASEQKGYIYRDGNLIKSIVYNAGSITTNTNSMKIGEEVNDQTGNRGNFTGKIDDIRLYKIALTETEILTLYHEGGW